jgi:hypothetical protein
VKKLTAEQFNEKYTVGVAVFYHPLTEKNKETRIAAVTRSEAWTLESGIAVVMVTGKAGCVALTHVEVLPIQGKSCDMCAGRENIGAPFCEWCGRRMPMPPPLTGIQKQIEDNYVEDVRKNGHPCDDYWDKLKP